MTDQIRPIRRDRTRGRNVDARRQPLGGACSIGGLAVSRLLPAPSRRENTRYSPSGVQVGASSREQDRS